MNPFERLKQFVGSNHYADPSWEAMDTPPAQEDGRAGWDTDESAHDVDDEEVGEEESTPGPQNRLEVKGFTVGPGWLASYITKAAGPCKPGQTAAQTGCTPATGEGGAKLPHSPELDKKAHHLLIKKVMEKYGVGESYQSMLELSITHPEEWKSWVQTAQALPKKSNVGYAILDLHNQLANSVVAEPAKILDATKWKNVGGQLGGNPGEQMEDESGQKYYVKFSKSPSHAANEVLAAKLYKLAGAAVPEVDLANTSQGVGIASKWLDVSSEFDAKHPQDQATAAENFGVHAWLANWDAVGLNFDNQVFAEGQLATVDAGGSLIYRAMGKEKPFGNIVGEWISMRDPNGPAKQAGIVFGKMTTEQLIAAAKKVTAIDDGHIKALVEKHWVNEPNLPSKEQLADTLVARKEWIKKWAALAKEAQASGVKLPIDVLPKQDQPEAAKPISPALPAMPHVPDHPKHASTHKKLAKMKAAAEAGDLEALNSLSSNPNAKNSYDKKVHQYKMALLSALKGGYQPAEAPSAKVPAFKSAKIKINADELPPVPEFYAKAFKEANTKAAKELLDIAKTGDIAAVQAFKVPPSEKFQQYQNELVQALHLQLNPPPPPKPYTGILSDFKKVYRNPKECEPNCEKMGMYLVVEKPGVPDVDFPKVKWQYTSSYHLTNKTEQAKHTKAIAGLKKDGVWEGIEDYTGGGSGKRNRALQDGTASEPTIKEAESFLKNSVELPAGLQLERNMSFTSIFTKAAAAKLAKSVGTIIQEPAYTSSSIGIRHGSVRWLFTVAPGARGIYVGGTGEHPSETEMILPPGSRYLITGSKKKGSEHWEISAMVLATLPEQCC